tara:strand:+ start:481 stop:1107 length:627 start_codon:yes stop_codon:yes gene_type:complete
MNINNVLLIDSALVITIIPILFLLQRIRKKSPILEMSNRGNLLRENYIKLPDKEKLINLEKHAKNKGSGIKFDSLNGAWKFISVWNKNKDEEDHFFSSLLRLFSADIEFKKENSIDNSPKFSVITSINFGLLIIEFSGSGYLKGKQPLLTFFINLIELKLGSNILLRRSLKGLKGKEKSFFALIALGESEEWLSARGQGGALVLWLKD